MPACLADISISSILANMHSSPFWNVVRTKFIAIVGSILRSTYEFAPWAMNASAINRLPGE
jgi:hypothetical protein